MSLDTRLVGLDLTVAQEETMRLLDKLRKRRRIIPVDLAHGDWSPVPPNAMQLAGDRCSYVAVDTRAKNDSEALRVIETEHEPTALDCRALQYLLDVPEQRIDVAQYIEREDRIAQLA